MRDDAYAIKVLGPGHVIASRRPEDIQAAWLDALRPAIEACIEAHASDRFWWGVRNRAQSRRITRRKQRGAW